MKSTHYLLMSALLLAASCASPKYTYYFDHYDYRAGKKLDDGKLQEVNTAATSTALPDQLLASNKGTLVEGQSNHRIVPTEKREVRLGQSLVNKAERRELRQQIKKYIRDIKEDKVEAGKANLDHDLKLAAIFGSVGVVALIIGTDAFVVIGGIALIIGVVFFVTWLMRQ